MWTIFAFTTLGLFGYIINKIRKKSYPIKYKSFEDNYEHDEYKLICYHIKHKDGTITNVATLSDEEIQNFEDENPIKYIVIDFMFNGRFMKFLTREKKEITFPIYEFDIVPPRFLYYPETIILNNIDVTNYLLRYVGPMTNFYSDVSESIRLEDILDEHPQFDDFDFNKGTLLMISNETPFDGRRVIARELPCKLFWKRHAAVEPIEANKINSLRF